MKCPRCASSALAEEVLLGIEVDRCGSCDGIWLDVGEGELVTRPEVAELPPELVERVAGLDTATAVTDDSADLPCPRCERPMTRESYAESKVEIDRCACGVWLDAGELEKITRYRATVMKVLTKHEDQTPDDDGFDLGFSSESLERAFARIYFDVGRDAEITE